MDPKRTPLYKAHKELGAKFTDFAGWEMPLKYLAGEKAEHLAVRKKCGLFDVSHMGEVELKGPGALSATERLTTNSTEKIKDGQCQYTLLCNDKGGTIDDTIVYRFSAERLLFCVNAANTAKVFEWIKGRAGGEVTVTDVSAEYAQIALQGPASKEVLEGTGEGTGFSISSIEPFHFTETALFGHKTIVSRTGYTGEDGVELYMAPDGAQTIWKGLMEAGKERGILPCGLVARDSLRIEMGYPLYGNELGDDISPIEAGLKSFVSFGTDFIGSEYLKKQAEEGTERRLVGLQVTGRGVPRGGFPVLASGEKVGVVTSGTFSVATEKGIAMAYVGPAHGAKGTELEIEIRGKGVKAVVVTRPFYRKDSSKKAEAI